MRGILPLIACAALALTAGCSAEKDFDQQFEERSAELEDKARRIEAESRAQLAAAREAEQAKAELSNEDTASK